MTTENVNEATNVAAEEVKTAKKVSRRGVGSARGTSRLKFSHELAKTNGLFLGHLDNVTVSMIKIGEESTGMPSFNGLEIPRITFTFASNEPEVNKRHYINLSFTAVESNTETIPGGKNEWTVTRVFDWVKHILNVYVLKGRELTEDEETALALDFEDFDEEGNYVPVESEVVIAAWRKFFENVENIINRGNNDKPYYKTKDNKDIPVWLKLVRYIKAGKKGWKAVNNGDLSFPSFVGEGCIEIYKQNTPASIRLDAVKEAIIPMDIKEAKTPNMPNAGVANNAMMGGVPVGDPMMMGGPAMNDINVAASEDMPF